jgi:hypothetical protein
MLSKKKKSIIFITLLLIGVLFHTTYPNYLNVNKKLTKNYGPSYVSININSDGVSTTVTDIDSVVPSTDELIQNLKENGYSITRYDVIDNLNISVNRIYAEKNNSFIDICYDLSNKDAIYIFEHYVDTYDEYFLLAQNERYVYCISDKKTFKKVGFKSLANIGIQYIYE